MAKYIIKQKYMSFKDSFAITDTNGQPRFQCKSKVITIPKKFWLQTADGRPLFFIKQRMFRFMFPRLDIYKEDKNGDFVAKVKVKYSAFRKKVAVSSEQYGDYTIYGNLRGWDFSVYEGSSADESIAASISKKVGRLADTYIVDIISGKESFMMALCIIIDFLYQKKH